MHVCSVNGRRILITLSIALAAAASDVTMGPRSQYRRTGTPDPAHRPAVASARTVRPIVRTAEFTDSVKPPVDHRDRKFTAAPGTFAPLVTIRV